MLLDAIQHHTFKVGQCVQFIVPAYKDDPVAEAIKKGGQGPFRVMSIDTIRPKCVCGGERKDAVHHGFNDGCNMHPQQLRITNVHGNVVHGTWSGLFFEPFSNF